MPYHKPAKVNQVLLSTNNIIEGSFCLYVVTFVVFLVLSIVIRGDWLWEAANINDKNNSAAVYVGRTVKVHNPLFSVGKLLRNNERNVFISQYNQNDSNSFKRCALSGPQKHITKESDGFHNHSTQLTMSCPNAWKRLHRIMFANSFGTLKQYFEVVI